MPKTLSSPDHQCYSRYFVRKYEEGGWKWNLSCQFCTNHGLVYKNISRTEQSSNFLVVGDNQRDSVVIAEKLFYHNSDHQNFIIAITLLIVLFFS